MGVCIERLRIVVGLYGTVDWSGDGERSCGGDGAVTVE